MAAQTVKAELELRPDSGGTLESIKIFIPTGALSFIKSLSSAL